MSKLQKEKDIIKNEFLEVEDYLGNENDDNENLQNYEMNNINNNEYNNDYENNMNNNIDLDSTQKAFVQTLNLQIKQLQELLEGKNKEFDNLNSENNKLKLMLIEEQKKLIDKENSIHSINLQKNNLEEELNKYKIESDDNQSKIKELNYKLIELNQNIIAKENIYNFNNKINNVLNQDKDNSNNEKNNSKVNEKYEVEIKRLNNLIDELEIKNNKLMFDNKVLNNKVTRIINEKNTEINISKSIYQNQIKNLNKVIGNLNNKITQLFSEKKIQKNYGGNGNNLIKKEIIEKFNELENKLNIYDKENCDLRKINQSIKCELEELKLVGDSKEKIIQKLQTDFELMENEYNNNMYNTQKIDDNLKINDINKSQYINELLSSQKALDKENKDLKFGLKQMTKKINDANKLYYKKKAELDKTLEVRDNKLKEYRTKITLLKMKINELHQEINILKEYRGDFISNNNQYSFLTQNNNETKNKIKKQKLRSFTPKTRGKRVNNYPFEINLENRVAQNDEINDYNDIFGDLKISEVPKESISMKRVSVKTNNKEKDKKEKNILKNENMNTAELDNDEQNLKYIQEYKNTLNKIDEQINKINS